MEADFFFGWKRGWSHQWLEFLPDRAEGFVVLHELGIHLGELFEHIPMGHEQFPLLMKARTTWTLIFTASGLLNTLAAMRAPCSVKG